MVNKTYNDILYDLDIWLQLVKQHHNFAFRRLYNV